MANIDLNRLFKKQSTITSPVDSDIVLNHPIKTQEVYSDFKLDLQTEIYQGKDINGQKTHNDIAKIINEDSIINSLRNILRTCFNSRLLNPEINFDLRQYLFENLTQAKAFFIGYDISTYLPIYEPRISVDGITVTAHINDDAYVIDMQIYIPSIKKQIELKTILDSSGFSFLKL